MGKSNFTNGSLINKYNKNRDALYLKMDKIENPISYNLDFNLLTVAANTGRSGITLYNSYNIIRDSNNLDLYTAMKKSIVMKLAVTIIQNINAKSINMKMNSSRLFSNDFYSRCMNDLANSNLSNLVNDAELLLLYLKQLTLILRSTNIFDDNNGLTAIKNFLFFNIPLYLKLFNSFWNKVKWEELFPSMPEEAESLKENRKVLINLMLRKRDRFRIDEISNAYFRIIGLNRANDLLLISFLDFGFFTWLYHFGIINYLNGSDMDPVEIELTEHGRKILGYFLQ